MYTKERLDELGFDGLFADGECACENSDLYPCGTDGKGCKPGYKHDCKENPLNGWCKEGFGWFISDEKIKTP